jgi:RimJ/RimL family protein N-acetyltransferase/acyl carrier protein
MVLLRNENRSTGHITLDRFVEIVAERLGKPVEDLAPDAELDEIGIDSIHRVEILVLVAELGVLLPEDDALGANSLRGYYEAYRACAADHGLDRVPSKPRTVRHGEVGMPRFSGAYTRMRPVMEADALFLYELSTQDENIVRWRYRGILPPFEQFRASLWQGVLTQAVISLKVSGEDIGLVTAYGADLHNNHVSLGAVFKADVHGTGLPVEAVRVFRDYLFNTWNIVKVYLEVPEYNLPQFDSVGMGEAREEGRFRAHLYYAGRYWDQYVFAMYRPEPVTAVEP